MLEGLTAKMNRRYFFFGCFGFAMACSRAARQPGPRVSIIRAKSYSADLQDVFRRILLEQQVPIKGLRILLKPNLVEFSARNPINTNPVFVAAAAEAFDHARRTYEAIAKESPVA